MYEGGSHPRCQSVAQVIGYYSAFDISDPQPLVVILTGHQVKVIIFPFLDEMQ